VRAFDTKTTRQGEARPFHEHTYRFPHRHWFTLALTFALVSANRDSYPRVNGLDGTETSLVVKDGRVSSVVFTEARYLRTVTRI
jgi:hypothetical protein